MSENPVLGGTDGVRGRFTEQAGPGMMNRETVAGLTSALLDELNLVDTVDTVVVARDTRPHGKVLKEAVIDAVVNRGAMAWDLDIAPTPAAQKIAKEYGASATIVMTASHNPVHDNGWKGMVGDRKPDKAEVETISSRYWQQTDAFGSDPMPGGQKMDMRQLLEWYEDEVVADIEQQFGTNVLSEKLFLYDGANGAGERITPTVLRRLGATVFEFACEGERGGIINLNCGAADLSGARNAIENLQHLSRQKGFVGVLANDGDADRLMGLGVRKLADRTDIVEINGNHAMWALAQGELGIVGTEYTNSGLVRAFHEVDIGFEYCANGDVNVTNALREAYQPTAENWRRGGEFTGHLIDIDWLGSGDGVRSAAWLASYLVTREMTLGDLYDELPLWPERMAKVETGAEGERLMEDKRVGKAIAEATHLLGEDARLIVRPSGTEPVVRIWAEAKNNPQLDNIIESLRGAIRQYSLT
jgi:phosphoglucosamine mutase